MVKRSNDLLKLQTKVSRISFVGQIILNTGIFTANCSVCYRGGQVPQSIRMINQCCTTST